MYNTYRVYDLSFVSAKHRRDAKPQFVFTVPGRFLKPLDERLRTLLKDREAYVSEYLAGNAPFSFPVDGLFGDGTLGFDVCGTIANNDGELELRIGLSADGVLSIALTIHFLARALCALPGGNADEDGLQQLDFTTTCEVNRPGGYGHAVSGLVSPVMLAWLKEHGAVARAFGFGAPAPIAVVNAMRETWCAVVPKPARPWARACDAHIASDGRFMLQCLGNACDIAIYPEALHGDPDYGTNFSCHNLDQPRQQITLLAGLAKLCELARK